MINITHYNFSQQGGPGHVANELSKYLNEINKVKSKVVYFTENKAKNDFIKNFMNITYSAFDNVIVKNSLRHPFFSLIRDEKISPPIDEIFHPHHIYHFHWMTGMINLHSLEKIRELETKVVWTFHDYRPVTGGCHFTSNCRQIHEDCTNCPMVRSIFKRNVHKNRLTRNKFFKNNHNLILVSPSKSMQRNLMTSINQEVHYIENPIDSKYFQEPKGRTELKGTSLDRYDLVLGFVAQDINDPRKNYAELIKFLKNSMKEDNLLVLAIGAHTKKSYKVGNHQIIEIPNVVDIENYYDVMDLLVVISNEESFGLTIAESAARGVAGFTLRNLSTAELIRHEETGFIGESIKDLERSLKLLINNKDLLKRLKLNASHEALKRWNIDRIGAAYVALYDQLLKK